MRTWRSGFRQDEEPQVYFRNPFGGLRRKRLRHRLTQREREVSTRTVIGRRTQVEGHSLQNCDVHQRFNSVRRLQYLPC